MTEDQKTLMIIKGAISDLPAAEREACMELAEHIRQTVKVAGEKVGRFALALVGAVIAAEP